MTICLLFYQPGLAGRFVFQQVTQFIIRVLKALSTVDFKGEFGDPRFKATLGHFTIKSQPGPIVMS